jgi:hypothetical protein
VLTTGVAGTIVESDSKLNPDIAGDKGVTPSRFDVVGWTESVRKREG